MHQRNQLFSIIIVTIFLLFSASASAEWGGQCVRYVKNKKPGGYVWDKLYPVKSNGQPTSTKEYWIPAKDIWNRLWVEQRGSTAKNSSVLVLDAFSSNSTGHVAIVTGVSGNKIYVKHSNWCNNNCETVSTGYFTNVGGGKVTYNGGLTKYPLLGYVYKP